MKITVEGGASLMRTLKRAGADIDDMKDTNQRVARQVAAVASSLAPRRSGRLAGSVKGNRAVAQAVIRSRLPYAGPIHWGWQSRGIRPNPFMVEAVNRTQPAIESWYLADLDRILGTVRGD